MPHIRHRLKVFHAGLRQEQWAINENKPACWMRVRQCEIEGWHVFCLCHEKVICLQLQTAFIYLLTCLASLSLPSHTVSLVHLLLRFPPSFPFLSFSPPSSSPSSPSLPLPSFFAKMAGSKNPGPQQKTPSALLRCSSALKGESPPFSTNIYT